LENVILLSCIDGFGGNFNSSEFFSGIKNKILLPHNFENDPGLALDMSSRGVCEHWKM